MGDWRLVRRVEREEGKDFPRRWKGEVRICMHQFGMLVIISKREGGHIGCDAPYVCVYKDIHVHVGNALED